MKTYHTPQFRNRKGIEVASYTCITAKEYLLLT